MTEGENSRQEGTKIVMLSTKLKGDNIDRWLWKTTFEESPDLSQQAWRHLNNRCERNPGIKTKLATTI